MLRSLLCIWIIISFLSTAIFPLQRSYADSFLGLSAPGSMVNLSPAFEPVLIKGLKVHPENPFLFDFIIDTGNSDLNAQDGQLKEESNKLIKYFLASLTVPEKDLWVNLSPYEKDRMIAPNLGQTQMGRDMLTQDYILKQLTASLIYPEKNLGKIFWDEVYAKAQEMYGTTQIPVNTFNKVWIVADKADIFEKGNAAYVVGTHLKVMLEEDYLALKKGTVPLKTMIRGQSAFSATHTIGSQVIREIIVPELEREVNADKNFAPLRQIFYSMILASWYKMALKDAILTQIYGNQSKVKVGINQEDPKTNDAIFNRYLQAYKKGVFNYIKEDINQSTKQVSPRKYFSGGEEFAALARPEAVIHRHQPWSDGAMTGNIFEVSGIGVPGKVRPAKDAAMTTIGQPLPWQTPLFEQIKRETSIEYVAQSTEMVNLLTRAKTYMTPPRPNQPINSLEKLGKVEIKPSIIYGPTGAGKESFFKLMNRWYWGNRHPGQEDNIGDIEPVIVNVDGDLNGLSKSELIKKFEGEDGYLARAFSEDAVLVLDGIEDADTIVQGYLYGILENRFKDAYTSYGSQSKIRINPAYIPIVATRNKDWSKTYRPDLIARLRVKFDLPSVQRRQGDSVLIYEYSNYVESHKRRVQYKPLSLQAGFLIEQDWSLNQIQVRGIQSLLETVLNNRSHSKSDSVYTTTSELIQAMKLLNPDTYLANIGTADLDSKNVPLDVNGEMISYKDNVDQRDSQLLDHPYLAIVHGDIPYFSQLGQIDEVKQYLQRNKVPREKAEQIVNGFNRYFSSEKNIGKLDINGFAARGWIDTEPIRSIRFELVGKPDDVDYTVKIILTSKNIDYQAEGQIKTSFVQGGLSLWVALRSWIARSIRVYEASFVKFTGESISDSTFDGVIAPGRFGLNIVFQGNTNAFLSKDRIAFFKKDWKGVSLEIDAAMTNQSEEIDHFVKENTGSLSQPQELQDALSYIAYELERASWASNYLTHGNRGPAPEVPRSLKQMRLVHKIRELLSKRFEYRFYIERGELIIENKRFLIARLGIFSLTKEIQREKDEFMAKQKYLYELKRKLEAWGGDRGGIDLTRSQMNVHKDGRGVQMQFDPVMIARIRHDGFDGLNFEIEKIVPVRNLPLFLGIKSGK